MSVNTPCGVVRSKEYLRSLVCSSSRILLNRYFTGLSFGGWRMFLALELHSGKHFLPHCSPQPQPCPLELLFSHSLRTKIDKGPTQPNSTWNMGPPGSLQQRGETEEPGTDLPQALGDTSSILTNHWAGLIMWSRLTKQDALRKY